ncbi:hypothetical protein GCM10009554_52530 [Kribbella koreensis]
MVIRFGASESAQLTFTSCRVLSAHATVTFVGTGSDEHAVSRVAPMTVARAADKTLRNLTIWPHPNSWTVA